MSARKNDAHSTDFDKLLEKYGTNRNELRKEIAKFLLRGTEKEENYDKNLSELVKSLGTELKKYAYKVTDPHKKRFLIMKILVGCSEEELLLVLKDKEGTLKTLQDLKNHSIIRNNHDMQSWDEDSLLAQGYEYKCLETSIRYQINVAGGYLGLTRSFKVLCLKDGVEDLKDLFYQQIQGNQISSFCRHHHQTLVQGSFDNCWSIGLGKILGKGETVEISIDTFCSGVYREDITFYAHECMQPTDILKVCGTLLGLGEHTPIKFCQYDNKASYLESRQPTTDFTNEQETVFLNKEATFEKKIIKPEIDSVACFDWSEAMKTIHNLD